MKVLLITKDKTLFTPESSSLKALQKMGEFVEQIHIVIFTDMSESYTVQKIDHKIFLYPTNSEAGLFSIRQAVNVAELQTLVSSRLMVDLIIADDPHYSAAVAYYLSRKHNKTFMVNVFENLSSDLADEGHFYAWVKKKISRYVLMHAHGIRVLSQVVAEAINAQIPNLEDRIYILPEPPKSEENEVTTNDIDIKARYPTFNLYIFTVVESQDKKIEKRLRIIIQTLLMRYPRAGLIVVDNNGLYKHNNTANLAWESGIRDLDFLYKNAHIFIDVSNQSKTGGALTGAALLGCPIVAAESPESTYMIHQGKNGFIADPDNPPEFCGRIAEIIETPGLRQSIRIFRYEMDQMMVDRTEVYEKSLASIWQKVSEEKAIFKPGAMEEYTKGFVYSLRNTREKMHEISKKLDKNIEVAGGKMKGPLSSHIKHKATSVFEGSPINEDFDTDNILRNR